MKKLLYLWVIIFFGASTASYAQEKAKAYFVREKKMLGAAMNAPINIDNKRCPLGNGAYMVVELDPDTYIFSTHNRRKPVELKLEAGKDYYFGFDVKFGATYKFNIKPISKKMGQVLIEEGLRELTCD